MLRLRSLSGRLPLMGIRMIGAGLRFVGLAAARRGRPAFAVLPVLHRPRAPIVAPSVRLVTRPAAAGAALDLVLGVPMRPLFLFNQRLPVRDRDLIIVRMDFRERQESVAIAAVIDEGGLERRLYPRDLGEIDVAAQLAAVRGLEVEFLDAVAAQHDHPGLLRVGGVDEHFVGHETVSWRRAIARPRGVASDTRGGKAAPNTGLKGWRRATRAEASAAAPPSTLICSTGRRG